MDNHNFEAHLGACKTVEEKTSGLEIFNYSEPSHGTVKETRLETYTFQDFLQQRSEFSPPLRPYSLDLLSSLRLVVQKDATHADTFNPEVVSLEIEHYESMIRTLRLPARAIEARSVVGPFFWSAFEPDKEDPRLSIIFRKSDTRRLEKTEGWEIVLSHAFNTGVTTGFVKGTSTSRVPEAIEQLKKCAPQVHHPMLLPLLLLSEHVGPERDHQLRDTRDWVRRLEQSISRRMEVEGEDVQESMADVEEMNRALAECHAQVLRKRPQDWIDLIEAMKGAMDLFREHSREELSGELEKTHNSICGRLGFYKSRLRGTEGYAKTTLERLRIQRDALTSVMSHRESIINLQMVAMITDQRRIAQASKKDGNALKRLSMLGAIFIPGTFIASLFSMEFFIIHDSGGDTSLYIAPQLWIYFAIAAPLTLVVVSVMWLWGRNKKRKADVERLEGIERDIATQLQRHNGHAKIA
ncbi:uncharacterized protein DNG_04402 [Cephalotrichum gorgonifer]|uniref:CorA domain-containing protein n=1 Tax=Cephalotrichum gorgonifer TaxID=2041049 RepID=A0AAE8MXX7_9PEZI|nr:uncharacterized protein DNG_04402 [Cephalotrichum gorgonifer]